MPKYPGIIYNRVSSWCSSPKSTVKRKQLAPNRLHTRSEKSKLKQLPDERKYRNQKQIPWENHIFKFHQALRIRRTEMRRSRWYRHNLQRGWSPPQQEVHTNSGIGESTKDSVGKGSRIVGKDRRPRFLFLSIPSGYGALVGSQSRCWLTKNKN